VCTYGIGPARSEQVRDQPTFAEEPGKGSVEHVQGPGVTAEGRHDEPAPVRREAAAAQRATALHDPCAGMQMSGDLAEDFRR